MKEYLKLLINEECGFPLGMGKLYHLLVGSYSREKDDLLDEDNKKMFQFPSEWEDNARMNSLFAAFRPKALDPVAWNSKMKFWETLIQKYLLHYKFPTFSVELLKKELSRNSKTPVCLDTVIDELKRSKKIAIAEDYSKLFLSSDSALFRIVKSVKTPLEWVYNKITSPVVTRPEPENVSYVHLEVAKLLAYNFYSKTTYEQRGKLLALKQLCDFTGISEEEIATIVRPLLDEGKAAVTLVPPDLVIKFAEENQPFVKITEVDRSLYQLEKNEQLLTTNIEKLEIEKEKALEKVLKNLKIDRKQMAKSYLRRRKELEKYIEKRTNALDNVRTVLEKLRQAESDSLVLDSYRLGVNALKQSLAENGLNERSVEATMDELEDILDVTRDIEESLARPIEANVDSDLEHELQYLIKHESEPEESVSNTSDVVSNRSEIPILPEGSRMKPEMDKRIPAFLE